MIKILPEQLLKECGWNNVDVGRGYIVTYCSCCRNQSMQHCTGKKEVDGQKMLRFECDTCKERLNGVRKYGNIDYGQVFKKAQ